MITLKLERGGQNKSIKSSTFSLKLKPKLNELSKKVIKCILIIQYVNKLLKNVTFNFCLETNRVRFNRKC